MKTPNFLLFALSILCLTTIAFAKTDTIELMTPRDLLSNNPTSNINLQNKRNSVASIYGLYVRQFAYVAPGDTCDHAAVMYPSSQNTTAGSLVMPMTIQPGKNVAVGSNYLYNMIYQAIYYLNVISPSFPPGCALPGCSWGTDTTTPYNWCIYLGAVAPVTVSAGYTANVPPSTDLASSGSYNYDLISNYIYLGPITCDDQLLTCHVSNQQTQSFS